MRRLNCQCPPTNYQHQQAPWSASGSVSIGSEGHTASFHIVRLATRHQHCDVAPVEQYGV
jgi:hypothetical protein